MDDDFLKPKNQTLEKRKKPEQVFIPELHSNPELMSYAEKLELGEEVVSEIFASFLEKNGLQCSLVDVEESKMIFNTDANPMQKIELMKLANDCLQGVFEIEFR